MKSKQCHLLTEKTSVKRMVMSKERMHIDKSEGFTLVEIMVAVFVVATMVVIVTPHLMGAGKMSQKTACAENQQMIKDAILEYQLVNHAFPSGDTLTQLNTLVNQQFLSQVPVEPSGGNYVITEPDANTVDVSCTVHGTLSNDD